MSKSKSALVLTPKEKRRLSLALVAAFSVPVIDDVEDFVWEAVFHYVKGLELYDPYTRGRTKELFDVVAPGGRGWSLKTLVCANLDVGSRFEFVIQRADIFAKAAALGFDELARNSDPEHLGAALIRHWNNKFELDASEQGVKDAREAILVKRKDRKKFVYVEVPCSILKEAEFTWHWTERKGLAGKGLQGSKGGQVRLKWYYGQKQLFEVRTIPPEAYTFTLAWTRRSMGEFIAALSSKRRARASDAKA